MKQSFFEKLTHVHMPPTQSFRFEYEPDKCTNCKACFQTCPTSCIQWDSEKKQPYVTGLGHMELACIGCNNCEAICPAQCIRMRGEYKVLKGRYKTPEERCGDMIPPCPFGENDLSRNFKDIAKELTETEKIIYKRRSIRLYKDKPVSRDHINRILEAGRYAPTQGNCQPFKFLVVTDKDLNRQVDQVAAKMLYRLKDFYNGKSRWHKILISLLSYISASKWDQRPIPAIEKIYQANDLITFYAPVVVHVLKDKRGISHPEIDATIAAHNMVLTAHALGLGTCYVGFIASTAPYVKKIRKLLGITYPYELVTSICVGHPKLKYNKPVHRGRVAVEWIE